MTAGLEGRGEVVCRGGGGGGGGAYLMKSMEAGT